MIPSHLYKTNFLIIKLSKHITLINDYSVYKLFIKLIYYLIALQTVACTKTRIFGYKRLKKRDLGAKKKLFENFILYYL